MASSVLALRTPLATARAADKADSRVEDRVEARLSQEPRLKDDRIKVDVDRGVAVLKGKVATVADRQRAEELAAGIAGVTRVDNRLEIDTAASKDRIEHNADQAKQRIDDNAKRAKEHVDESAERAKEHVDRNANSVRAEDRRAEERRADDRRYEDRRADDRRPAADRGAPVERRTGAGEAVSDSWITTKVKAQMVGVDQLKGSDISVDTDRDGVVTLTGSVPNEAARARAIEIARTTKGVHRVVDQLKLRR